ncbi:HNH endonuclease [Serratia ureilytica]|uniref:HNH endonuclease n=1 Tax=Serratia ureilytica TaxID=300181 RepID=UPI00254CF669|nr:HNH endonuclease [Serratia ureilytica]MDK7593145.1 HNH endonuclease [Serratia ureilytica]
MYLTVSDLEGICRNAYDNFSALNHAEKKGSYWNDSDNHELAEFKSYIKNFYIDQQNFTCPYCKQRIVVDHNLVWDAEHIIPKDTHPQFLMEPSNLCVSCKDCNSAKGNKNVLSNKNRKTLPNKSEDYTITHPHYDDYAENIRVIELCGYYLPLNDKGRKTIEICGLLRFAYTYANYGDLSLKTKELIVKLGSQLAECTTSYEEAALLSFIRELASKGLAQMTADYLNEE